MTNFYHYYIEIKNRFSLLLFAWVTTILVSYIYKEILLFLIIEPSLHGSESTMYFIFTNVTEIFSVYISIIMFIGNHVIVLYLIYHLTLFFSLGLYSFEYRNLLYVIRICFFFFLISVFFFSKILLPVSWHFFLSFQSFNFLKPVDLYFESKLNEYFTFYTTFYLLCVCYCQAFVLLVFFFEHIKTDLLKIKQYRKVFYFCFLLVSTLVTPPDIISQLLLCMNIIVIYELLLCGLIWKSAITKLKYQPILEHKNTNKT